MADDVVTRLVVQGGPTFIRVLSEAAITQQRLIDVVSRAATLPPTQVAENMVAASKAVQNADRATEGFIETLEESAPEFEKIINLISRQTKALTENAKAAEIKAQKDKELAEQAANFAKTIPTGRQTGLVQQAGGFEQQTRNFGTQPQNLPNVSANFAQTQQAQFINQLVTQQALADEKLVRGTQLREQKRTQALNDGIQQRGIRLEQDIRNFQTAMAKKQQILNASIRAEEMLERRREQNEQQAARRRNIRLSEDAAQRGLEKQRIAAGTDFFSQRTGVPSRQLTGFNVATRDLTDRTSATAIATKNMNNAIGETDQVTQKATRSQFTYLGLLSAIHAASFLATGRTFTLLGSFVTLGAAFTRVSLAAGLAGVAIGGLLGLFNVVSTGIERLQQIANSAATSLTKLGAAILAAFAGATVASTKLASSVEDAFSEIVAFGEPVQGELEILDAKISQIARTFGESATDVATAASQFIRAGGSISQAIGENAVEAVTKLQVASRGELVPRDAARAIVVLTNAFGAAGITAEKAADIFVGVAQKSALSFTEVFQAFQQAAPQAANIGIPLEELAATMAVLANNGLRGQVAGTGFKQVLIDLVNPSKQARDKLEEYNISLFDTNEKLRPLPVVFGELKRAFGDQAEQLEKTGDASRAQAIAAIFGARANLAASIIARTGAEAFEEMQVALEGVSATDVANVLLAPTSAQLRIAKTNVEELARSFGGPLNVAVGSIIKQFNDLIQTIDRVNFERAGQAILAVISGQGFGPIIESVNKLAETQPRLAEFFLVLLRSALTVRNAFVDQFIPALTGAASTVQSAFDRVSIAPTFNAITRAIVGVINAGSRLTGFIAELVSDFITGEGTGQRLRDTVTGLATGLATTFVGSLALAAFSMGAAIKVLEAVGKAVFELSKDVDKFSNVYELSWQLVKDVTNNALKSIAPGLQAFGEAYVNMSKILTGDFSEGTLDSFNNAIDRLVNSAVTSLPLAERALQAVGGDIDKAIQGSSNTIGRLSELISELQERIEGFEAAGLGDSGLVAGLRATKANLEDLRAVQLGIFRNLQEQKHHGGGREIPLISGLNEIIAKWEEERANFENSPIDFATLFDFNEGDIPNFFTNLAQQVQEFQALFDRSAAERDSSLPGFLDRPGTEKAGEDFERTARTIRDLARDTNREIDNLVEDTLLKQEELSQETVRKIADTFTEFDRQIDKLDEDTRERKSDILEGIIDSRVDRQFQENLSNSLDDSERKYQAHIQRRDALEQQALTANRRVHQLRIQDTDQMLSRIQRSEERTFQNAQATQERAFQKSQQVASRALTKRQEAEQDALTKQLQRESTARDEQRRLAEAKTPEEREQVQLDINRSRQDAQFQEGQETQLKNLRNKHERENIAFAESQETQAFQFRMQQQIAEYNFRLLLEAKFQQVKRALEEREITRENQESLDLLDRNIQHAEIEAIRRRNNQIAQQVLLDAYQDNTVVPRQNARIDREAAKRRRELGTNTIRQIFQTLEQADRQREQNINQADKQTRTIQQRALERGETLTEQLGRTPPELTNELDQIIGRLAITRLLFEQNQDAALEFFGIIGPGAVGNIANRAPGAVTDRPVRSLPLQGTFLLPDNLNIQSANALQLAMPTDFGRILSAGIATGLRMAGMTTNNTRPNQVIIQGNTYSTDDLWQQVNQFLYGTARR